MATKEPLKANTRSNLPRPGGGIPTRTGLPRPSGLKPPSTSNLKPPAPSKMALPTRPAAAANNTNSTGNTSIKRSASNSPTKDDKPAAKKTRLDPPLDRHISRKAAAPSASKITRPAAGRPAPKAAPAAVPKAPVRANKVKASNPRAGARPATSKAAPPANKNNAGSKRPAWDYKGRLEDMESALSLFKSKNEETNSQLAQLMTVRQELEGEIAVKTEISSKTSEEKTKLEQHIRALEDELATVRRQLQSQISDLEFSKSSLERQREALEGELRASQQEAAGLKSTVASITSANAGLKAEFDSTKVCLDQALEAGRMKDQTIAQNKVTIAELQQIITDLNEGAREHEMERRRLHNTVQELKGNIRVFCRVRPLIGEERQDNEGEITHMSFPDNDNKVLELERVGETAANDTLGNLPKNGKKHEFSFDRVFGPDAGQAVVFEEISQLVQSALDGYNVCIFAYGQTGSGKTFTMEGPAKKSGEAGEGMIPRAVKQIFLSAQALTDKDWQYDFEASFLEIYNETIRDLLGEEGKKDVKHDIKMISKDSTETLVTNLTKVQVTTQDQVHQLLAKAARNRAVAETKCNERSSRSHSVFRLRLSGLNNVTSEKCVGNLNLIDLAGSERLKESGSQGARLRETQCINTSLANLGNVIMALANKDQFIPYRNSKLTHLLQHSLGGNSKTLMFVNVNPREDFIGETLCSLRFATKVNSCHIGTAQKRTK